MNDTTPTSPEVMAAVERVSAELRTLIGMLQANTPCPETIAVVETAGRLMDAARIHAVTGVARNPLAAEELGYSTATAAVAALAQVSDGTARARLAVAAVVSRDRSITGAELPPACPTLAAGLSAGAVGLEAATLVTRELDILAGRVPSEVFMVTEQAMVNLACGLDPTGTHELPPVSVDYLTREIKQITATADPDGALPREERAMRRRDFRIGRQNADGLFPASGLLMPEIAVSLSAAIEAFRRSPQFVDSAHPTASTDSAASPASAANADSGTADISFEEELGVNDPRTPGQRRHDAFAEVVMAGVSSPTQPQLDGAPITVIVIAHQGDLAHPDGVDGDPIGTMVGSTVPVSRREVHRYIDQVGYRTATTDPTGRVTALGSLQRCFTNKQRLAIAARDGYQCAKPGCTSPHYTLQVHHVVPARDGGPTHVDNGILLCYYCHPQADTGPWHYTMINGMPHVRGPGNPHWRPLRATRQHAA